jgi:nitrilase
MKISAIQMCSSGDIDANLANAQTLIIQAANEGAALAVLPEMFPIFGHESTAKIAAKENFKHGKIQDFLSNVAQQNNIWLVGGTIPIACDIENKIRSACIVFDNQGNIVAHYDKIHLFDVTISPTEIYLESDTVDAGLDTVVIDTPLGKIGLAICFDLRFPDLFLELRTKGAEIICVPSAFTVTTGNAHWELLTRSRAIDSLCYIIGACQGGMHDNGRATYGKSIIVDPWGTVKAIKTDIEAGVITANIDLEYLKHVRKILPIHSE